METTPRATNESLPEEFFVRLGQGEERTDQMLSATVHEACREIAQHGDPLSEIAELRGFQPDPDEVTEPEDRRGVYPLSPDIRDYQSPRQHG